MDIVIEQITKESLAQNLDQYIEILKGIPNEYWGREHFLAELPGKYQLSLSAMIDEKLIGYIISTSKDSLTAHINKFMILSEFRGSGIGSRMFNYYVNLVRNNEKNIITLKVYKKNEAAIRFYLRHGFKQESESVDNKNSEVLVKMRKSI